MLIAACDAQPSATVARGRMGTLAVAVPSDMILGAMMFEGEDVWDPSTRVGHRPDGQVASFDVALDRSTWQLVRFTDADRMEVRRNRARYITVEVDRERVPTDDHGIADRHRAFVVDTMHRRLSDETTDASGLRVAVNASPVGKDDIQGFNTNYFNASPTVNITCNKNIQVVAPYADISTCLEDFALSGVATGVRAYINKTDVPNWKKIHDVLEQQLRRFFTA